MIEQLLTTLKDDSPLPPPGVEFIGEVATADFIDGEALASAIGLEAGIAQFSDEPWLHFILDGKELYVAKKPYRHSISWDHINAAGAVFGDKTIEINGLEYKVRLLKSVASGSTYTGGFNVSDPVEAYGSEWNRLMYSVHSGYSSPVSKEGIRFGTLVQYTDADLVLRSSSGSGFRGWCQESVSTDPTARVQRGHNGVHYVLWDIASIANWHLGWRPVLELVE